MLTYIMRCSSKQQLSMLDKRIAEDHANNAFIYIYIYINIFI